MRRFYLKLHIDIDLLPLFWIEVDGLYDKVTIGWSVKWLFIELVWRNGK